MKIVDRQSGISRNIVYSKSIRFLYNTFVGRCLLKILANRMVAKIVGSFMNTRCSCFMKKIIMSHNDFDVDKFNLDNCKSYNAFFTRKYYSKYLQVPSECNKFISPCESKLMIFKINENNTFSIKNSNYSLNDIIQNPLCNEYRNGYLLVFRLEVSDYHRYCFIDDGKIDNYTFIDGFLHTVQPLVYDKVKIFHQNSREWCILHTKHFGDIIEVEVGALLIGKIVNNKMIKTFKRGDEKGYFEFGGSTILLMVHDDVVIFDKDILENSSNGNETVVRYGEIIGRRK